MEKEVALEFLSWLVENRHACKELADSMEGDPLMKPQVLTLRFRLRFIDQAIERFATLMELDG